MMARSRWYAGQRPGRYSWEAFRYAYDGEPSEDQTPQFSMIIGPFQTRRAARWVENNPGFWFVSIADAERAAKPVEVEHE